MQSNSVRGMYESFCKTIEIKHSGEFSCENLISSKQII